MTEWASRRCAELILEIGRRDAPPGRDRRRRGPPRSGRRSRSGSTRSRGSSGSRSTATRSARILAGARAGAGSARTTTPITVRPPSWRSDLEREIDLIEEVARIHGYEHIPEDRAVPLTSAPRGHRERVEAAGPRRSDRARVRRGGHLQPRRRGARRPARARRGRRRRSGSSIRAGSARSPCGRAWCRACWPLAAHNEAHGNPDAELFEIANVYLPRPGRPLPDEPTRLALVSGRDFRGSRGSSRRCSTGSTSHEPAGGAAGRCRPLRPRARPPSCSWARRTWATSARSTRASSTAFELRGGVLGGRAGARRPDRAGPTSSPSITPLPPFPAVVRDLSLVVARDSPWAELAAAAVRRPAARPRSGRLPRHLPGRELPEDRAEPPLRPAFRTPSGP